MNDAEIQQLIETTANKVVSELKHNRMIKDNVTYNDASAILHNYYESAHKDSRITYAINDLRFDSYSRIIPMYFQDGKKLEDIAEEMNCDVSTIVRNKKRLCLEIYNRII